MGLLSDTVFKGAFKCFWRVFRETKSEYSSLQQWWDVGKGQIKQLCLQYTFNATKVMTRSMEALEREIVELQSLVDSTGDGEHIQVLKRKTQLYLTCWVSLLEGLWSDLGFRLSLRWMLPLTFSLGWSVRIGRGD